jgi:streptomycin 6-kinase
VTEGDFQIPERLAQNQLRINNEAGRNWLQRLPSIAHAVAQRWQLSFESPFANAFTDYVGTVRRADGTPAVIKLCFIDDEFFSQEAALRAFGGQGSVVLLDADLAQGALLLERIEPGDSLSILTDDVAEIHAAADLMQRLWRPTPEDFAFPRIGEWLDRASLPQTLPGQKRSLPWLAGTFTQAQEVLLAAGDERLLHGDLHFDNILSSHRGWLAIDPKGIVGDVAWEFAPLLINNLRAAGDRWHAVVRRRIDQLCDELSLDRERAYAITAARCLQARFWSLHDNSIPGADHVERALYCAEELAKGP